MQFAAAVPPLLFMVIWHAEVGIKILSISHRLTLERSFLFTRSDIEGGGVAKDPQYFQMFTSVKNTKIFH